MRPLLVLLLALPASAQTDLSGVEVTYRGEDLWRDAQGGFLGKREGDKVVLVYDFFGKTKRYSACPRAPGRDGGPVDCAAAQRAIDDAFQMWAEAAGRLVIRRRSGKERVNIWVSWATQLPGVVMPRGRSVDNSRDSMAPDAPVVEGASGIDKPRVPDGKKEYGSVFFLDSYCWYVDSDAACPPATNPSGVKPVSNARPLRSAALHELGHSLGFGHFSANTIMAQAGGAGRYELTPLDREAVRRLYERVGR